MCTSSHHAAMLLAKILDSLFPCFQLIIHSLPNITVQAKVNVGLPARACAFSPNGAHLAVGTKIGVVRVLQVRHVCLDSGHCRSTCLCTPACPCCIAT